jgi:hypothetical protein
MGNCGGSEAATKSTNEPTAIGKTSQQPKEISVKSNTSSTSGGTSTGGQNSQQQNGKEKEEEERKEESKTVNAAAKPATGSSTAAPSRTKSSELNHKDSHSRGGPSPSPSSSPTPQQIAAVQRIQRLVRNKSAWRLAQEEREWRVRLP